MHAILLAIGMCLVASATMIIQNCFLRKISVNYIALVLGMILALVFGNELISFKPELFMGLIIAPLLFFEGQKIVFTISRVVGSQLLVSL
ncbi:hypothetical protein C5L18_001622 [Lactobacillus amylolyticus]|uniref:Uncharacterized protein n=1 Tax=Lactobacillus amylolyticus DSM 11664 TaxID=585524 RepID=D4YV20_9LACO|nr:hypothetical protein [Lactobacillus amylolyticus]EFG54967.1 hypothetical protein HMPREF0493_1381 [Lactobacillus amylolyticus DSM 11664]TDG61193.1 hypothetical protein C5L18_001622 [Lactobacillus amylolyticus]